MQSKTSCRCKHGDKWPCEACFLEKWHEPMPLQPSMDGGSRMLGIALSVLLVALGSLGLLLVCWVC